ncbi:MAG: DUF4405 domain-containing protein [Oscillospiraceae bacterium]|nr:DUF4405 domain-containing protein [Oscillospiraceae bacterium]
MKIKRKIQIFADFAMTVMLPLLMAYNMIGDTLHEWIGAAMFVMFIIHHVINFRFAASIAKGKYTANRIFITAVDFLLLADMLALMLSAVILSRHVFAFLHLNVSFSFARTAHLLGSYLGFILMSVHIGIHFHTVISTVQKKISNHNRILNIISKVLCAAISSYGLYVFLSRKISAYLFLKTQFVFLDFSEPLILFLFDYISMMILFGAVGYYISKLLRLTDKIRRKNGGNV